MRESQASFDDLPILSELRHELRRAFAAHQTTPSPAPMRLNRRRPSRVRRRGAAIPARALALVGAGGSIAAAAMAAFLLASPATQPAYALTQHSDGSVTVTIHDLATAVPALNARFAAMGIDETVVPVQASCKASTDPPTLFADPQATVNETLTLTPGRKYLAPGFTGVLAAEQLANGEVAISIEAIKPPVPHCFPATAYTMRRTGTTANGVPIYQAVPVNPTTGP